jgi:hypothetical protein
MNDFIATLCYFLWSMAKSVRPGLRYRKKTDGTTTCPNCGFEIPSQHFISVAASIMGARGTGASKARDPKKMSRAGKKGGWKKGRPRKVLP